jgi:bifunctional non-homologous end joining protein LigD
MMSNKKLETYKKKRDFSVSSEPKATTYLKKHDELRFVVQEHDATHLHYDFRLEMGGVLKSWAVPKGPSLNPEDKRLAVQVEDHPIEYQNFEGIIPSGQYGAGTVLLWDRGTYKASHESSLLQGYKKGHLTITLNGTKLKGGFVLQRIKDGDKPLWLLIKVKDDHENKKHDVLKNNKSVVSHKTLKEITQREPHE